MHESRSLELSPLPLWGRASAYVRALMALALLLPNGSSVNEFSVFANKPVVFIREPFIDSALSLDEVLALCPNLLTNLASRSL